MKILFTSDLHLHGDTVDDILAIIRKRISSSNPDVFVISGDVSDMPSYNTYGFFSEFDLPVVFCLGNHEFAHSTVDETLEKYRHDYGVAASHGVKNVHCLDTEGHFDTLGVRFYGNVLWYDGSLYNGLDKDKYIVKVYKNWLDSSIREFSPLEENARCIGRIMHEQDDTKGLVLVTHCVPHRKLNQFDVLAPMGIANCYSGVYDLFARGIHPDIALCGHTHKRALYEHRMDGKAIRCYNSGNDYFFRTNDIVFDEVEL